MSEAVFCCVPVQGFCRPHRPPKSLLQRPPLRTRRTLLFDAGSIPHWSPICRVQRGLNGGLCNGISGAVRAAETLHALNTCGRGFADRPSSSHGIVTITQLIYLAYIPWDILVQFLYSSCTPKLCELVQFLCILVQTCLLEISFKREILGRLHPR